MDGLVFCAKNVCLLHSRELSVNECSKVDFCKLSNVHNWINISGAPLASLFLNVSNDAFFVLRVFTREECVVSGYWLESFVEKIVILSSQNVV